MISQRCRLLREVWISLLPQQARHFRRSLGIDDSDGGYRPVLVVYPNHPFAQRQEIRLIDARDENFIAVTKDFSMRKFFNDSCDLAGFSPKIVLECDYMLRSRMLASEYGIVFTTESGARAGVLGNAVFVGIIDPPLRRTQAIFTNRTPLFVTGRLGLSRLYH